MSSPNFPRFICREKLKSGNGFRYRYTIPAAESKAHGLTSHGGRWKSKRFPTPEAAVIARDVHFKELGISHGLGADAKNEQASEVHLIESKDGQTASITTPRGRVDTAEQLLVHANVDTDVWELDREKLNCWDMTTGDGNTYQNFQVTVWLRRKEVLVDADYVENLIRSLPRAKPVKSKRQEGDHLLEINICDLHIGKLCWSRETGENYDIKIARERFCDAVKQLASLAHGFPIEKILFPIGNDYFNADNYRNETTDGTPQNCDVRFPKMYEEGVALLVWAIDYLRNIAPVDVVLIQGNHDRQVSFCAAHTMKMYFEKCPEVEVDSNPNPRKYVRYHDNMIGLFHGDKLKPKDVLAVMAAECPFWSDVKYREAHAGHYHHEATKEHPGLVVRYLTSLSGTDAWHGLAGYVKTRTAAQAFVYSRKNGMKAALVHNA